MMKAVIYHNEDIILPTERSHFLYKTWIFLLPLGSAKRTGRIIRDQRTWYHIFSHMGTCLIRDRGMFKLEINHGLSF
jgi:hypothetical protein